MPTRWSGVNEADLFRHLDGNIASGHSHGSSPTATSIDVPPDVQERNPPPVRRLRSVALAAALSLFGAAVLVHQVGYRPAAAEAAVAADSYAWRTVRIDGGEVTWQGRPVDAAARQRFGYMPAERGMYQRMRVRDHLVYYARLSGRRDGAAARIQDAAKRSEKAARLVLDEAASNRRKASFCVSGV